MDPTEREDLVSMASGEKEGPSDLSLSGGTRSPLRALRGRVRCESPMSGRLTRFCHIREQRVRDDPSGGEAITVEGPSVDMRSQVGAEWAFVSHRNPTPTCCVTER